MGIFDEMRQSRRPIDFNRIAAIQFLDTALGADRRQMIKQYVEKRRPRGARRRSGMAGGAGALAGIRLRLPGKPGAGAGRSREPAMEVGDAADLRAAPALPRHRREAPRLPPRTLDSCEVDRAAPALRARLRARRPPGCRRAAERWARRDAVERRAGVHVRAARAAAQHRQLVADRDRLGERPAARVGTQARVRDDAANDRGILCRPHEQVRARAQDRRRVRPDASLPRHDPAFRPARARDARAAPDRDR